jgi:hypothetical protein
MELEPACSLHPSFCALASAALTQVGDQVMGFFEPEGTFYPCEIVEVCTTSCFLSCPSLFSANISNTHTHTHTSHTPSTHMHVYSFTCSNILFLFSLTMFNVPFLNTHTYIYIYIYIYMNNTHNTHNTHTHMQVRALTYVVHFFDSPETEYVVLFNFVVVVVVVLLWLCCGVCFFV